MAQYIRIDGLLVEVEADERGARAVSNENTREINNRSLEQIQTVLRARYSFGYPTCLDLAQGRELFNILKPEEFGIELSETFEIVPEQSTSALVVHHRNASYDAV